MLWIRWTVVLVLAVALIGCGGSPSKVSKGDLEQVRSSYDSLKVGMTHEQVEQTMRKGNLIRMGSSSMSGAAIEEYKLEAYHDDDWNKQRDLFVRFLYFAEGELVDMSSTRIDYREQPEVVRGWVGE